MTLIKGQLKRGLTVATFAVAMAWVESAVVFYLRTLADRIQPHQPDPLPMVAGLAGVELVREAATLIMLLAVGLLAGRDLRSRWGYAAIAFGVWDIFYYIFLRIICHWPESFLDWDVLFLLPLPWWGPVIAPMLIATLMVIWGSLATQWEHSPDAPPRAEWMAWSVNFAGIFLALFVFMEDTLRVANQGADAVRQVLPVRFDWPLFVIALALMAAPIVQCLVKLRRSAPRRNAPAIVPTMPVPPVEFEQSGRG